MSATFREFRRRAQTALQDDHLQNALERATGHFREGRENALAALPDADGLRNRFKAMRQRTLADLGAHLARFEAQARANGIQVHYATNAAEAQQIIVDIARSHGAQRVAKGKSMATEEVHLNAALEAAGLTVTETDLGEYIVQLAGEPPAHIIAPAIHKTRDQVADLFTHVAGVAPPSDDIPALTATARQVLRETFLKADIGITGGNILIAESGSLVLVTNEGNGRMVTSLPPVHIALVGIEKIAPTWDDAALWLSLLARSATGQPMSVYTTVINGPRRDDEVDGPDEVHIVLLDNGRRRLLGTRYEEVLQCIRCGACLNVCPVYRHVGGHTYGSPYSGPIGAVISPLLFGLEEYPALPFASTLCGACLDVCPARIDLPRMLIALREDLAEQGHLPVGLTLAERLAAWALEDADRLERIGHVLRPIAAPFSAQEAVRLGARRVPPPARHAYRELTDLPATPPAITGTPPPRRTPPDSPPASHVGEPSLSERFIQALTAAKGNVVAAASKEEAWKAVGLLLKELEAERVVVNAEPPLRTEWLRERWPQVRWTVAGEVPPADFRQAAETADLGLSTAKAALAQTGTLILYTGPAHSRLTTLLPPVHIALLPMDRLTDDPFTWAQTLDRSALPSALMMISGPSKTGDIEQTLSLGVHGPHRLIVILYPVTPA